MTGQFEPAALTPAERDRFWSKVQRGNGCWRWNGSKDQDGYGLFKLRGRMVRAHRLAVFLATGAWPGPALVCHRCDTPGCVRPDHLFRGSAAANAADMVAKGRSAHLRGEAHGGARLTATTVQEIRRLAALGTEQGTIARQFGTTRSNVSAIARGKSWRHLGGV